MSDCCEHVRNAQITVALPRLQQRSPGLLANPPFQTVAAGTLECTSHWCTEDFSEVLAARP